MDSFFCYLCTVPQPFAQFHSPLQCQLMIFNLEENLQNCFTLDCADKRASCTFFIEGKSHMDAWKVHSGSFWNFVVHSISRLYSTWSGHYSGTIDL